MNTFFTQILITLMHVFFVFYIYIYIYFYFLIFLVNADSHYCNIFYGLLSCIIELILQIYAEKNCNNILLKEDEHPFLHDSDYFFFLCKIISSFHPYFTLVFLLLILLSVYLYYLNQHK